MQTKHISQFSQIEVRTNTIYLILYRESRVMDEFQFYSTAVMYEPYYLI